MVTATLAASVFAQLMQEFPGILPAFGPGEFSSLPTYTCLPYRARAETPRIAEAPHCTTFSLVAADMLRAQFTGC